MSGFQLRRLTMLMEPEPGNPLEVEGTLNPAAVRGPDGELYLFPRLVGRGNYSRIGIARVRFDGAGDPCGVERRLALEPEANTSDDLMAAVVARPAYHVRRAVPALRDDHGVLPESANRLRRIGRSVSLEASGAGDLRTV
jgi:hypothetical protein